MGVKLTDLIKRKHCQRCKERDAVWMCRECLNYFCQHLCSNKISAKVATCVDCRHNGGR